MIRGVIGDYPSVSFGRSAVVHADAFAWLAQIPAESLSGIVCDPPYGVKEYIPEQLAIRTSGQGVWRLPPSFDGAVRAPLPRFTALSSAERAIIQEFFRVFGTLAGVALKPGGHLIIAANTFLSQLVYAAVVEAGLEFRGEIIRLVQTFRGGDRPKLGEHEFPDVGSLPRGKFEPWGLFRKPLPQAMTLRDCLATHGTGGLRRLADGSPFGDVISSERTPRRERRLAPHPSLKPQRFLRQIVRAILPLGRGIIADPFMGAGSTVAAAEAVGYGCIGVERHEPYYQLALEAIPRLTQLECD